MMKQLLTIISFFAIFMGRVAVLQAQENPDAILGVWFNEEKDGKIKIYKEEGKFYGKLVWVDDDKPDFTPFDEKNPDPELQKRKKVGIILLNDFVYDDERWEDGTIYDPKSGKTYSCYMKLLEDGKLFVRGYIGFSLIGRTTYWTRP